MTAPVDRFIAASSIFLGAFLLFQIQPLIARAILPWFGGAASVWTASMLFFQTALLAGYAYAAWMVKKRPARLHILLLAGSIALLPIIPAAGWKPSGSQEPISRIVLLLAATVGPQYVLLASTSPLLQGLWSGGGAIPYHWFAISNAGSLLGLLTYPVLMEPFLGMHAQAWAWSGAYVAYAILTGAALWRVRTSNPETVAAEKVSRRTGAIWVVLPAAATALLLASTQFILTNILPSPLLWVLPLSAYLLSFIVTFGRTRSYRPAVFTRLAIAGLLGLAGLLQWPSLGFRVTASTAIATAGVFLVCCYLHGEVAARRPQGGALTRFYLSIAAGGALGGLGIGVAAPLILPMFVDFPVALGFCAALLAAIEWGRGRRPRMISALTALLVVYVGVMHTGALAAGSVALKRNFYGALRVTEEYVGVNPVVRARILTHGVIHHGSQLLDNSRRRTPTMYYAQGTGVHLAIEETRAANQRVGVVGLGTGTLAAYGRAGDVYRFYEINPQVVNVARTMFSYMADTEAHVEVIVGDARLTLEWEQPQRYDVLVLDAFSSDSIPAHLLTREAMQLYLRHLRPDGMLAFHASNKVFSLVPVVAAAAREHSLSGLVVDAREDANTYRASATWVLLSRNPRAFQPSLSSRFWGKGVPPWTKPGVQVWTDQYHNLWNAL